LFAPKIKDKENSYELDNIFYEKCFNLSDHKCEECGCQLPEEFKTGKRLFCHIIADLILYNPTKI
jgi:hypothetical protein